MTDAFDDVEPGEDLLLHDQVATELARHGGMAPRSVSKGWREVRNIYEFLLPASGWFVDIPASDGVGTINEQLHTALDEEHGVDELHVSHLTDDGTAARSVTTHIARWVRGQILDDGSLPRGIVYPSKYGTDIENYALWLRRRDDGTGTVADPLELVDEYAVLLRNQTFRNCCQPAATQDLLKTFPPHRCYPPLPRHPSRPQSAARREPGYPATPPRANVSCVSIRTCIFMSSRLATRMIGCLCIHANGAFEMTRVVVACPVRRLR